MDLGYGEMWHNEFDASLAGEFNLIPRSQREFYSDFVADSLSDQLSSLSLLHPKSRSISPLPSTLQPLQGLCSAKTTPFGFISGGAKLGQRLYGGKCINEPFYEIYLPNLRKNEVEVLQLKQARARVLKRQQTRLLKGGMVHRNNNVLNNGSFTRESVGTGVFHPLLFDRPSSSQTSSVKKHDRSRGIKLRS